MASKLAQSIRAARRAAGLTQEQLGRRLGLKGRAVYRWENDAAAPSKRNRNALVVALQAVRPDVAAWLSTAIAEAEGSAPAAPAEPAAPPIDEAAVLEYALFTMADELDLPARRVRGALKRFLENLRAGKLTLESTERRLEEWIARHDDPTVEP